MNEYSSDWQPEEPSSQDRFAALQRVKAPAMGMIVTGALGVVANLVGAVLALLPGSGFGADPEMYREMGLEGFEFMGGPAFAIGQTAIGLAITVVIILGGLKMRQLESYGLALTASILAWIPCTSPCCIISIPFGIWAFVVLLDKNVKQAFR